MISNNAPTLKTRLGLYERLISNLTEEEKTGCWVWREGQPPQIRIASRKEQAQRVMYSVVNGYMPPKKRISTTCGNPRCCKPTHLKLK